MSGFGLKGAPAGAGVTGGETVSACTRWAGGQVGVGLAATAGALLGAAAAGAAADAETGGSVTLPRE